MESKGNPKAYNTKEQAAGVMQLRKIMVAHINKISGSNYTMQDRFDSLKSIAMFDSLMLKRNPEYDADLACLLWNAGTLYPKNKRVELMVEKYKQKVYENY